LQTKFEAEFNWRMNLCAHRINIVTIYRLRTHGFKATFSDLPRPVWCWLRRQGTKRTTPPAVKFAFSSVALKFSTYSGLSVKINCLPSHRAAVQININTARAHSRRAPREEKRPGTVVLVRRRVRVDVNFGLKLGRLISERLLAFDSAAPPISFYIYFLSAFFSLSLFSQLTFCVSGESEKTRATGVALRGAAGG
jgi:hypothetical protein